MMKKFNLIIILIILFGAKLDSKTIKVEQFKEKLKIGFWSSWKIKCGIAMYTEHLYNALNKQDYKVFVYSNQTPIPELIKKIKEDKINILNIQYEAGLFHWAKTIARNLQEFIQVIKKIKKLGVKIIMTMHMERKDSKELISLADQCIYHRPSVNFKSDKINLIPIGVPVSNIKESKLSLRKKYNFKEDDIILTTMGFMLKPKKYPEILESLAAFIKYNPNIKIQLLTSFTNREVLYKQSLLENKRIKKIIRKYNLENQVIHITKFLSQEEVAKRLFLSDIGYLWGDNESQASSASIKEFISVRLPFVINDCYRYKKDIIPGMVKSPNNKLLFAKKIFETVKNKLYLIDLSKDLDEFYQEMNYDNIIKKHLKVFHKTLAN